MTNAGVVSIANTGVVLTSITVGALLGVDSIDATGAVDMDYGSADVTDHTFVSDGGTVVIDGNITIPDTANIGSASDTDAIAIAANGVVTFSQATALAADSIDAITEVAAALKSGADGTFVTGTSGDANDILVWDANGDAISSGEALSEVVTAARVGGTSANLDDTDASIEWEDAAALDATGALSANSADSDVYIDGSVDNVHLSDDAALPLVISGDPDSLDDTLATNGAKLYRGGYIRYNAAGEATLDAFTTAGQNVSIEFYPSVAIIVNPDAAQTITRNGVALAQGEALINSSEFGMCVLTYLGTNSIDAVCSSTITEETP
jgi:hypothetical protein